MNHQREDHDLAFLLQYENVAWYEDGAVKILDRRVYPMEERFVICHTHEEVARAIADMVTQSAGPYYAAAHGMALAAWECRESPDPLSFLRAVAFRLSHARPTTASRMEAITGESLERAEAALAAGKRPVDALQEYAVALMERRYRNIARCAGFLADCLPERSVIMTQCFAETVIGMLLRTAAEQGKTVRMICPETRPFLQGARLTASVAVQQGCDVTVITDNMPAAVLSSGAVDLFTSAADCICMDGTIINKVGTLQIALCASRFGVPYYVTGSPDRRKSGVRDVSIEYRDGNAVLEHLGRRTTLPGVKGLYPAFDATPGALVTGVVTDRGIFLPAELSQYFRPGDDDFPSA
ncbi:MAG: s-methyl-5-thioribose-1-phosphate isomerase [Clostridia bacterium]|nr:s-methyl-5-thioribose-1-phosphate isomerase [Clostridia bacterium]